jgi:hypothetical protein
MIDGKLEVSVKSPACNPGSEPVHKSIDLAKLDDTFDLLAPDEAQRGRCNHAKEPISAHYMSEEFRLFAATAANRLSFGCHYLQRFEIIDERW